MQLVFLFALRAQTKGNQVAVTQFKIVVLILNALDLVAVDNMPIDEAGCIFATWVNFTQMVVSM